jgi:hypothetical protein
MHKIKHLLAMTFLAFANANAVADSNALTTKYVMDLEAQLQMAFTDYNAVHAVLIERCSQIFPASKSSLVDAITQWRTKNADAQQQLHQLLLNGLMRGSGLSESEAGAQIARSSEMMTQLLTSQFNKLPEAQLKPACEGQYAAQSLASPMLDFGSLLSKLQPGKVHP